MTKVVNLFKQAYDQYIGRAGKGKDGYFCNPYSLKTGALKGSTLSLFKRYFYERLATDPEFKKRVLNLKGKTLGCFCKPGPCHGDIIKEFLDNN